MKFSTLITSLAACVSIAASPIDSESQAGTIQKINIRKYVNAENIYNQVQFAAKIPKEMFINKVNQGISDAEKALDFGLDFGNKLKKLTPEQKNMLYTWWSSASVKYQESFPTDPEELEKVVLPDLKQFVKLVYQKEAHEVLQDFIKSLD